MEFTRMYDGDEGSDFEYSQFNSAVGGDDIEMSNAKGICDTDADVLAHATEEDWVKMMYREADKLDRLSKPQLIKLVEHLHGDDKYLAEQAKNTLCLSVTKLVINQCTTRYKTTYANNKMEMFQSGMQGVVKGLKTYDPNKGALTTHIFRYIIHDLQEFVVSTNDSTTYYTAQTKIIMRAIDEKKKRGIEWTEDDLAIELEIPKSTIRECFARINYETKQSLNDDDCTLSETLASNALTPEEAYLAKERTSMVADALENSLDTDAEKKIIKMTYGFESEQPLTDKAIAMQLGLTEANVRTIKNAALIKIERYYKKKNGFNKSPKGSSGRRKNRDNITMPDIWSTSQETMTRDNADLDSLDEGYFGMLFA